MDRAQIVSKIFSLTNQDVSQMMLPEILKILEDFRKKHHPDVSGSDTNDLVSEINVLIYAIKSELKDEAETPLPAIVQPISESPLFLKLEIAQGNETIEKLRSTVNRQAKVEDIRSSFKRDADSIVGMLGKPGFERPATIGILLVSFLFIAKQAVSLFETLKNLPGIFSYITDFILIFSLVAVLIANLRQRLIYNYRMKLKMILLSPATLATFSEKYKYRWRRELTESNLHDDIKDWIREQLKLPSAKKEAHGSKGEGTGKKQHWRDQLNLSYNKLKGIFLDYDLELLASVFLPVFLLYLLEQGFVKECRYEFLNRVFVLHES